MVISRKAERISDEVTLDNVTWRIARDSRHPPLQRIHSRPHSSLRALTRHSRHAAIQLIYAAYLQASQGLDEVVDLVHIWSVNISV